MFKKIWDWLKKHWLLSTLGLFILAFLVGVFYIPLIFGFISYIDRHAYDTDYSKLPKPYSQRGEPLPPTDVPVTLPPDPGEAGKATLEGIDSNNDGVRDDLEREIVYMYPQNEEVRRVLRAMVKKKQNFLFSGSSSDLLTNSIKESFSLEDCYLFLVFGPIGENLDFTNLHLLSNILKNTENRKYTYHDNELRVKAFAGGGVPFSCYSAKGLY